MMRILVIDDDRPVGSAIEASLRGHNFEVVFADSGRRGVVAFKAAGFDLAIIDIFMPEMDGLEVIKIFHARAPTLPIIAMSGYRLQKTKGTTPDFLEMAMSLGATYRLRKPFGPRQLKAAVVASMAACPLNAV